jgi:Mg-chelatase subunit ChlD
MSKGFTNDVAAVLQTLKSLEAAGGGDLAEDVVSALQRAADLPWEGRSSSIVLLTDGPGHGRELNPDPHTFSDHYYDRVLPGVPSVDSVLRKITDASIDLVLGSMRAQVTTRFLNTFIPYFHGKDCEVFACDLFEEQGGSASSSISASARAPTGSTVPCTHLIFCLDESGSMRRDAASLVHAYDAFLQQRMTDQNMDDRVTVIKFQSEARIEGGPQAVAQPITSAPKLQPTATGGTSFQRALVQVEYALRHPAARGLRPLVVFMSDGEDSDASSTVTQLYNAYAAQGFRMECVGLGSGSGAQFPVLVKMARAGGGQFRHATDGSSLAQAFTAIALSATPVNRLVERFGAKMAKDMANKIIANRI